MPQVAAYSLTSKQVSCSFSNKTFYKLAVLNPRQLAVYSLTSKQVAPKLEFIMLAVLHPRQLTVYSLTSKQISLAVYSRILRNLFRSDQKFPLFQCTYIITYVYVNAQTERSSISVERGSTYL